MPMVIIPAIGAGVFAGLSGATVLGLTGFALGAVVFGVNLALGALQFALGGKPKMPELPSFTPLSARAQSRTQQFKQAITARRLLVGEARISGPLVFAESTNDNRYLHLVIVHGEGPFTEIGETWLNDDPIFVDDLDGSGNVTAGKYSGKVRIKKHLGTDAQSADSDLTGETSLTSAARGRGVAYSYVRLQFDQDLFPTSIPNYSVWAKGPAVLDTRDDVTRWTPNAMLQTRAWMVDAQTGLGTLAAEIQDDITDASANTSDEIVPVAAGVAHTVASVDTDTADERLTLNGDLLEFQTGDRVDVTSSGTIPGGLGAGMFVIVVRRKSTSHKAIAIQLASSLANAYAGIPANITSAGSGTITTTKTGEPRYVACGLIETDRRPADIFGDLLTAMGGSAVHAGGTWRVSPGHYVAPTVTLDENHLRSTLAVATKHSRRERFNAVKGVYVSPLNHGQPTDYPPLTDAAFEAEDNARKVWREHDLPFTPRPQAARRLAKRTLRRHRKQITVTAEWSLRALLVQCGDTVAIDNTRMGWTAKPFEVARWHLKVRDADGAPELVVAMTLREIDATVDAWTSAEESAIAPVPRTTLPDAFNVETPSSLDAETEIVLTAANDELGYIVGSWAAPTDFYVSNDGHSEHQFKKSADAGWSQSWSIEGDKTSTRIGPLQPDVKYDWRMRFRNHLGVRGDWAQLIGFTLGAAGSGADNLVDDGFYSQPVTLAVDDGGYLEAVVTITDDGAYS